MSWQFCCRSFIVRKIHKRQDHRIRFFAGIAGTRFSENGNSCKMYSSFCLFVFFGSCFMRGQCAGERSHAKMRVCFNPHYSFYSFIYPDTPLLRPHDSVRTFFSLLMGNIGQRIKNVLKGRNHAPVVLQKCNTIFRNAKNKI